MALLNSQRFEQILNSLSEAKPLLVLGDVGVDQYTKGHVSRISPEAPVPVLHVSETEYKLGLAANICDNLKSLGVDSLLCGIVGEDVTGNLLEELLEDMDLKTWGIVRSKRCVSTLKQRIMAGHQQICRVDYESGESIGVRERELIYARLEDFLGQHQALILQDYGKGLFNQKILRDIIALCKESKKDIYVDPSNLTDPLNYKGATLLKPNEKEARGMVQRLGYRETSPSRWAEILLDKLELEKVVITLGDKGMGLMERSKLGHFHLVPTQALDVFDVSGAGDTAISAIGACLSSGTTLEEALWIGNLASGVVVGKRGTATVSLEELKEFYQRRLEEESKKSRESESKPENLNVGLSN